MLLDPTAGPAELTRRLVDIPSVSGDERAIADAVEAAVRTAPHLEVIRDGDPVMCPRAVPSKRSWPRRAPTLMPERSFPDAAPFDVAPRSEEPGGRVGRTRREGDHQPAALD